MRKAVANLLAHERICRVATAAEDGTLHVVPVCQVLDGGRIYFGSDRNSTKVRHLRKNAHITVVVDLYSEDWDFLKGVMIQGTGRLIRGGPQFRKIRALLYRKYPLYAGNAALEESDSVVVEVTPVRLSTWGFA